MSLTLLLPLLLAAEPAKAVPAAADDPPIRIWINEDGRFLRGDRAKVHVRAEEDGYLVVLQSDTEGHLRVLFPLDPTDDNFVRGGKKYEVEGRGGRDAFDVGDRSGRGTVYAAVSRAPFRFDEYVLSDHWDYRALEPQRFPKNAEPELTDLVRRMAQGSFDYDVLSYYVVESVAYTNDFYYRPSAGFYYDDFGCGYYRSCGSGLSVSLFFGQPLYNRHYYGPFHYAYSPLYDPFFYDPWYYQPYYYRPAYYYPRHYWGYPYHYRTVVHNHYWNRSYTPYRFRDRSLATTDYRDRRYTFGRAVNTVYTPPRSRFTEAENVSPIRRTLDRDEGVRPEATVSRRVGGTTVTDRAEPRRANERRSEATAIEARRARPAETTGASDSRTRREDMPVDVTPSRASSDDSDRRSARDSDDGSAPRATRAEPRAEPRSEPRAEPRSEPRAAPRSEPRAQPRSEPRAEPRSAPRSEPRAAPRSSGGGRSSWSSGGDGGRRSSGGGGGGVSSGGGRRR